MPPKRPPGVICRKCKVAVYAYGYSLNKWRAKNPVADQNPIVCRDGGKHEPARVGQLFKGEEIYPPPDPSLYDARCQACGCYLRLTRNGYGAHSYDSSGSPNCPAKYYGDHTPIRIYPPTVAEKPTPEPQP